ncbi:MAG: YcjF family protein [Xanthobacteraceae bacterium]|nr:YcjF family protein [Xanthobacteraceae bacterium]
MDLRAVQSRLNRLDCALRSGLMVLATGDEQGDADMANDPTESGAAPLTEAERDEQASQVVDRFSLWSGAAGLVPIPIVDVAAVAGVQLQMLRRLSEIYGVPFAENRGKSVVTALAGAIIPASTATTTAMTFGSLIKGIPGIGTTIGALTMPVYSAGVTFVIGRVFMKHFASGGTLLDFDPPDYKEFIKTQQEKVASKFGRGKSGSAA